MKRILLLLVFVLFSTNALAELNKNEQFTVDLMMSGDLSSLKHAARKIHDTQLSNPAVLDVAVEILLVNYANVYAAQVDTFSWLVKAIGVAGSNRYHDALQEVVERAKIKKLRKYAKKALKTVGSAGDVKQYELGKVGVEVPEFL